MATHLPNPLPVRFVLPADEASKTQWRWARGDGELSLNGVQLTLSGRRWRPFLRAVPQTITFERGQVVDVMQQGDRLHCSVKLDGGKTEPLALQFGSEEIAREVAARLPAERSALVVAQQAFEQALASTGVQVWVTPAMAIICVLVFIAMVVDGVPLAPRGPELIPWGTNYGPKTLGGEAWRLYTSMFLHFGVMHLVLNTVSLLSLGPLTERLLGNVRFLILYVVAGLCGSMSSLLWNPDVNSAGASGAIFGVMGAYLAIMVNPHAGVPAEIAKVNRKLALMLLFVNIANSFRPGIDMAAHLGGLVAGFPLGWLFTRPLPRPYEPPDNGSPAAGLVVAGGLMALLAVALFHPSEATLSRRAFRAAVGQFVVAEQAATALEQELNELARSKRITEEEWARRAVSELLPRWDHVVDTVFLIPEGSTPDEIELVVDLRRYAQGEILMLQYYAEGILEDDRNKAWQANQVYKKQLARREMVHDALKRY